jgi:hypothetical protein
MPDSEAYGKARFPYVVQNGNESARSGVLSAGLDGHRNRNLAGFAHAQQTQPRFKVIAIAEKGGIHKPFVDAAKVGWRTRPSQMDSPSTTSRIPTRSTTRFCRNTSYSFS